jgi:hypothetical protein
MPGSCTSTTSSPPQERTKGGNTAPSVLTHETITPRVPEQTLPGPPRAPFGVPYTTRSQVDLRRLARPPEGATPFTVVGLVRAPTIEQGRGSPAMEPLTRSTTDLSITDRLATPTTD